MNNGKACRQLTALMESTIWVRYRDLSKPKQLCDVIKAYFKKVIKVDGQYAMAKVTSCQLESYPSATEWISAQDKIINDLPICDIMIEDSCRKCYMMFNLPNTAEWQTFAFTPQRTVKVETVATTVTHLLSFGAHLSRARGLAPDAPLFVTKNGRG